MMRNGCRAELTPDQCAYLRFFAKHRRDGRPAFERPADAIDALADRVEKAHAVEPRFYRLHETLQV